MRTVRMRGILSSDVGWARCNGQTLTRGIERRDGGVTMYESRPVECRVFQAGETRFNYYGNLVEGKPELKWVLLDGNTFTPNSAVEHLREQGLTAEEADEYIAGLEPRVLIG